MKYLSYCDDEFIPHADVHLLGLDNSSVCQSTGFTLEQAILKARDIKRAGKKVMIWVNRFIFEAELEKVMADLEALMNEVDGYMLMDFGIMKRLRDKGFCGELVCQTDTTLTNAQDAQFLIKQGFDKIVTARELSLEEYEEMAKMLGERMIFHSFGRHRLTHSRRPFVTAYGEYRGMELTQNKAYQIIEEQRKDPYIIVEETSGSHIFDAKIYWALDEAKKLEELGLQDFFYEAFLIDKEALGKALEGKSIEAMKAAFPELQFTRALLDFKTTEKKVEG